MHSLMVTLMASRSMRTTLKISKSGPMMRVAKVLGGKRILRDSGSQTMGKILGKAQRILHALLACLVCSLL